MNQPITTDKEQHQAIHADDKLCLHLSCNSDCILIVRAIVRVMTQRAKLSLRHSNRIAVAVDELYANIINHAYAGELQGRIEIEACILHEGDKQAALLFTFRDYAATLWKPDLQAMANQDLASPPTPGGLGIKLICSIADHCEHQQLEDGNAWRLIFNIESNKHK